MRFRQIASSCALALAVTLSAPVLAHGHKDKRHGGPDMRPEWKGDRYDDPAYDTVRRGPEFGRVREDWLVECRMRVAGSGGPGPFAGGPIGGPGPRDACETALDDYYASGAGYGPGTVMVPVVVPGRPCVEHVTTEYVRPARRFIPRAAPRPDKRIRLAPDKRVPMK